MHLIKYIPFFYFQQTRLNNLKALIFHSAYEWVPAGLLALYCFPEGGTVLKIFVYYLAFISVYEIGYMINDHLAFSEENGRKRIGQLSKNGIVLFTMIRLAFFLSITFFLGHTHATLWWSWYIILSIQFAIHNFIRPTSLKVITFSFLAFSRFLSPIVFLLPPTWIVSISFPIFLNYVLFRLFIYMDSKEMLKKFDRLTPQYRLGYYAVLFGFSAVVSLLFSSWIPIFFNLYYFLAAAIFTLLPASSRSFST